MNMRPFFFVLSFVLSGCLIPVDVSDSGAESADDGGDGGRSEGDAGSDDAGGGCPPVVLQSQGTGSVVIPVAGCAGIPLAVTGPDGAAIGTLDEGTNTTFAANEPGLYTVTIGSGATAQVIQVEIYEVVPPDAGFLRTYVERVDSCLPLGLTPAGRLVCQRDQHVTVYETDGGISTDFPGVDLAVAGGVVWSLNNGTIERRVETPQGLVLEGSRADARVSAGIVGGTSAASTLRGGSQEFVEFAWDAGSVSTRSWWIEVGGQFVFRDEATNTFWTNALCSVRPGCVSSSCPAIYACPPWGEVATVISLLPDRVLLARGPWGEDRTIADIARPVQASQPVVFRHVPLSSGGFGNRAMGALFTDIWTSKSVAVISPPGRSSHFLVSQEFMLLNTPGWVLTKIDPMTVRFIPVP